MRTLTLTRVARRRGLAGLAALALPIGILALSGSPAQAQAAPGSPIEVFIDSTASSSVSDAIQNGWWGHEGAAGGTGTATSFLDLDGSDPDLSIFTNPGDVRVAFVTTSADGSAEHPVASAGQTIGQVFGSGSWFADMGLGSGLNGTTNANDSVQVISTPAEYTAWYQGGQPLQGFDSSLVLHDVTAPGNPVSTKPQGKSILNRWATGAHVSLVYYQSTGAIDPSTGMPIVAVGPDGHAITAYMPFDTVAKPGDSVRTSAGYTDVAFGTPAVSTTTMLAATPASPQVVNTLVSLDATVTAASGTAAGMVQFLKDGANLGSPVAVNGSGHAVLSGQNLGPVGTYQLKAVYTPAAGFIASESASQAYQITAAPVIQTHTALSAVPGADSSEPVALEATVTADDASCPAGTVVFKDGSNTVATVTAPTSSPCKFAANPTLSAGSHSLTAVFTPNAPATYGVSTSPAVVCTVAPGSSESIDEQTITGNIPEGTIVITTPYTPSSPLNLGDLHLTSDLSQYTASATFEDIHLLDTRAGAQPWTVTALAGALTNGPSSINGQNVGLTNLVPDNTTGASTPFVQQVGLGLIASFNNPAANPAVAPAAAGNQGLGGTPKTILSANQGPSDVQYKGLLTLNAPTTTSPGLYTGTITFTAS